MRLLPYLLSAALVIVAASSAVFITPGANSGDLYAPVFKDDAGVTVQMPIELHAKKAGIEIRFTSSLDTQSAADPENWNVEVSTIDQAEKPAVVGASGVAQLAQAQMTKAQHDPLKVKSVSVGTDDRRVFLEIEGMKPVMQMSIRYSIKSADGSDLKGEVINTVHALGE